MSSRVERGAASSGRVSIPNSVKKTIEDIKEFTGKNHSEDEIYAMLKECSMDPNETTQKLLLLDTFHEVKKKRDRRKEIFTKEAAESKWKPNTQVWANRGRGNYSSRYLSHDAVGGRSLAGSNESATGPLSEKGTRKVPLSTSQEMKRDGTSSSSVAAKVARDNNVSADGDVNQSSIGDSSNSATSIPSAPASGSYFSSSDPVLLPSQDSALHNPVGTIGHNVRELIANNSAESKQDAARILSPGSGISNMQQKMLKEHIQHLEPMLPVSSTIGVSAVSRPSSNHHNRSQVIDPQKVGVGKELKPKPTNSSVGRGATVAFSSEAVSVGCHSILHPTSVVLTLKEDTAEVQKKLDESHISVGQHVIIPDNLHVLEAEKLGFCFGSFDATVGLDVNDKTPPLSEFDAIDESVKGMQLSCEKASVDVEDAEIKHHDQPAQGPESLAISEVEVSSANAIYGSNKEIVPGTNQQHVVHSSSNYNFGFMLPIVNGQLTTSESSESQVSDAPRQPGFVVQQPFDPASYYAQFYGSGMENDGRLSPFHFAAAASKYNENAAIISPQTSQTPQELQSGGTTASPTPVVTQATGIMQSSMNAQHPLPIFRQPTGVHVPHYPPNYFPYGPYFSPFYIPPPAMHQFLSNGAFPQQPQSGNLYPTPTGATAKYPIPQQKQQGSNITNSTHIGVPGSYPPYGLSMPNYTSSLATSAVTLTSNEDHHAAPQVKENNIYNEGPGGVWFAAPNRDISGALQASTSMYNHLPQAGQLAFAPTQPTFPGIFHPAAQAATLHPLLQHSQQPITTSADVAVGPTTSVYQQQPHHQQLNWSNNY